ncbi:MAG: hypothetical protein JWO47_441 [Candidatus Saccharibacteria bacterium]|nr:hypothetical protein [Candidatus Saccharibacteria bacterium]
MENSPRNTSEEDRAAAAKAESLKDDDDDDNEKLEKPAPRHAPGISIEKVKAAEKAQEKHEKPRLSISDRLLESIGAKPEKAGTTTEAKLGSKSNGEKETADENEQGPKEVSEASLADDTGKLNDDEVGFDPDSKLPDFNANKPAAEAVKTDEPTEPAEPSATEPAEAKHPKHPKNHEEPVADATLENADWEEEDLPASNAVHASSGEVRPESEHEDEEFAEIPLAPEAEGEEPEEEAGPVEPELIESGLESEGPPEPPEIEPPTAAGDAGEPPEPPVTTTHYYRSGGGGGGGGGWSGGGGGGAPSPWYNAAAADRDRARALADAEYQGRREGTRRGVLTGLLFGWLIGRHGKKKQARGFKKDLNAKEKQINSLKTEQNAAAMRMEALKTNQERLVDMQDKRSTPPVAPANASQVPKESLTQAFKRERPLKSVEKQLVRSVVEVLPLGSSREKARAAEKAAEVLEVAATKAALTAVERSTHPTARGFAAERARRSQAEAARVNPEDQAVSEDMYQVGQGRRVETSAWHRIEIDEKTGKPVEDPEVAYGEEFRREQAKEIFTDDNAAARADDAETYKQQDRTNEHRGDRSHADARREMGPAVGSPAAQLGGLAAASFASSDQKYTDETYSSRPQESGLGAGIPPVMHPDHLKHQNLLRYASEPAVWVVAAIIVVALFAIGIFR